MTTPQTLETRRITEELYALPATMPVADLGLLPVNSFLIRGSQPLLADTGLAPLGPALLDQIRHCIAPEEIRWIWISHADPDHTGNIEAVLQAAPQARLAMSFMTAGKLQLQGRSFERAEILTPGATLDIGDRQLQILQPPYYDAPETLSFFDPRSRALFAADAWGGLLQQPLSCATQMSQDTLRRAITDWLAIDVPYFHGLDANYLDAALNAVEDLHPDILLSGHLPPAPMAGLGTLLREIHADLQPGLARAA
jgi:flavorubredoxin